MHKNVERTKNTANSLIDQTHDAVIGATDSAQRAVESAAEGVAEGAHEAGEYIRAGADTASRGAHRGLRVAAKAISGGYTRAHSDLSRAAAAATDFVAENPAKAVLLATGAGFVLGMVVGRRRSSA